MRFSGASINVRGGRVRSAADYCVFVEKFPRASMSYFAVKQWLAWVAQWFHYDGRPPWAAQIHSSRIVSNPLASYAPTDDDSTMRATHIASSRRLRHMGLNRRRHGLDQSWYGSESVPWRAVAKDWNQILSVASNLGWYAAINQPNEDEDEKGHWLQLCVAVEVTHGSMSIMMKWRCCRFRRCGWPLPRRRPLLHQILILPSPHLLHAFSPVWLVSLPIWCPRLRIAEWRQARNHRIRAIRSSELELSQRPGDEWRKESELRKNERQTSDEVRSIAILLHFAYSGRTDLIDMWDGLSWSSIFVDFELTGDGKIASTHLRPLAYTFVMPSSSRAYAWWKVMMRSNLFSVECFRLYIDIDCITAVVQFFWISHLTEATPPTAPTKPLRVGTNWETNRWSKIDFNCNTAKKS